ncbi:rod shape-determining protein RodA [Aliidiomarina minuta]|uniref:Peptidoglycan glycosyltransferase MrdB n=1 Tax=Aliidiomarina minuta TaxID=880057 RepID=A0A432W5E0_9GAMM|nr:rod shape-determining protein RodA [Aliidiomarina minuta]RUO25277.1 rod shape-determining protein RodA [Aliidiomarina minuta]
MQTTEERQRNIWLARMHIDLPLLLVLMALSVISLAVIYSAGGQDIHLVNRQAVRIGISFAVLFVMAQISPLTYQRFAIPVFVIGVALLVAVLLVGEVGKGAQRWLDIGVTRIQPAEIMKLAAPLMLAWYCSRQELPISISVVIMGLILIMVPTLLIAQQPDLGTALLVACSGLFVLFLAGMSWRLIISGFILLGSFLPVAWFFLMRDYQRQRVLTFLNPETDPLGAGYHIIQSKIAIGSGGIEGKGWLQGTQSQLEFLPERHTDFIFSVFSEEFGLIGVCALLLFYGFIIYRGLTIAMRAQHVFSKLLAGSITLTVFIYALVNIGMVSGLLPVVGVPLPLISYGGTSMVTIMAGFGILMAISTHRRMVLRD